MDAFRKTGMALGLIVLLLMPVGAGASGHGALAMLVFAGVFWLAHAVLRPVQTSSGSAGPGLMLAQALTALAAAALLVSLGEALRALAGVAWHVDLWGWAVAAAWAVLLVRLVWPPRANTRLAQGAEAAMRRLNDLGARASDPAKRAMGDSARTADTQRAPAARRTGARRAKSPDRREAGRVPAPAAARPAMPRAETMPTPAPDARTAPGPAQEAPVAVATPPTPEEPAAEEPAASLPPSPDLPEDTRRALDAVMADADRLPMEGASEEALDAILARATGVAPEAAVHAVLARRADLHATRRDRRLLLRHATAPDTVAALAGQRAPVQAFEAVVAAADAQALSEFISRAEMLLEAELPVTEDLPSVARLLEIADQIEDAHEGEADLLVTLAYRLEDIALAADGSGAEG